MSEVYVDRSALKIGALGAVGVILAGLFAYQFFRLGAEAGLAEILSVLGLGIGWLALVCLRVFLIKTLNIALGTAFFEVLAVWLMMPQKFSALNLLGIVIFFLLLVVGFIGGRADLNNSLKIKFWRVSRRTVPTALTGLALLITLSVLQSFNLTEFSIPRSAFNFFLKSSEPVIAGFIPDFSLEAKVNDVLKSFVESRLPPGTPAPVIDEAISGLKKSIRETTGVNVSGEEKVGEALYDISIAKLLTLPSTLKVLALIVLGLLIFLFIKGLAFVLNWIIIMLAFLIFQMLVAFNFMHVGTESRNQEIIVVD